VDLTRVDTAPGTARLWPDVDLTGEALGPYRLSKRIGAGGMGIVYEAEGPEGTCAVKVLSALLAAEPDVRTRFRREAAALRSLDHPGVVRILADGEDRGFCWYAMERVIGEDLRARVTRGRLPPEEVEAIARRLLDVLSAVHQRGLVHRDVKPGNILLASDGAKLCDFGIARFDGATTLTASAALMGSLRYMAPEQRYGRSDARSDLHSLGIVLHEALAGGVPGEADLPLGVPARLRRLLDALLAARPEDRPMDARGALDLLNRQPRRRVLAVAATLAALALPLGGYWSWRLATPAQTSAKVASPETAPSPAALSNIQLGEQGVGSPRQASTPQVANPPAPQAQQLDAAEADEPTPQAIQQSTAKHKISVGKAGLHSNTDNERAQMREQAAEKQSGEMSLGDSTGGTGRLGTKGSLKKKKPKVAAKVPTQAD
jgi:eukaryotic-like serine/threonine-protein kinase